MLGDLIKGEELIDGKVTKTLPRIQVFGCPWYHDSVIREKQYANM